MGSLASLVLPTVDTTNVQIQQIQKRFNLDMVDIQQLLKIFNTVDKDNSGLVDFTEFFEFVNEPSRDVLVMIFKLVTHCERDEEELDFPMWMQAVLGFSCLTEEEIEKSIYHLHDVDKNGFLDISELTVMIRNLHAENHIYPSQLTASLVKTYILEDGKLDFEEFRHACLTHPMFLWPVFRTQHRMRMKLLGKDLWQKLNARSRDIYTYNLLEKGPAGDDQGMFDGIRECCDLYCCTFLGYYDRDQMIRAEMEAGEGIQNHRRALGEFEKDPELIRYEQEEKERELRHTKKEKRECGTSEDSSEEEEIIEEIVVKNDDDEYGETAADIKRREGFNAQLKERKEKQREERKRNPMYIDQDHFDSEWYDYSDEIEDLGDMSVEHDEYPDSRKIF